MVQGQIDRYRQVESLRVFLMTKENYSDHPIGSALSFNLFNKIVDVRRMIQLASLLTLNA